MTREVVSNDILDAAKAGTLHWNLMPAQLVTMSIQRNEARLSAEGALVAETGKFTGRSPEDKYVVDHPEITDIIDWNKGTKRLPPAIFADLRQRALAHMAGRTLFVQELWAGADPKSRLNVRVVTEQAWHSLFARNMFLRPTPEERAGFSPDWTVLQLPSMTADPASHGTNSSTVIALDLKSKLVLVIGTAYAGEIKKSIFTVLNYILPEQGVFPMHCSANMGADGDTAVFFGLSGTGKTTLSADPSRTLIGDDEHGWNADGIFNFEGGCYAKVINLDPKGEPEIYSASTRFGTILENVILDPVTAATDFFDGTLTENTRSSYPLDFIPNASATGIGRHPSNVVMLTCDAFGVLPPISRLRPDQAMYHFLSGYTARLAGTERGVTTPQAVFSACFGAPFMPRHPTVYAELMGQKLREHNAPCWLLNTGWSGGGAADGGKRMSLKVTRALLQAALDGSLNKGSFRADPVFGLEVPEACPGVDPALLNPRDAWADPAAYDAAAREVAALFEKNFAKFEGRVDSAIAAGGIRVAG